MLENEVQNLKFELKMKNIDVEALKKETDLAKDQANELR